MKNWVIKLFIIISVLFLTNQAFARKKCGELKHDTFQDLDFLDFAGDYFSKQIHTSYSFEVIQDTLFAISAAYKRIPLTPVGRDTFETAKDFMKTIIFKRDYEQSVSDCFIYDDDHHKISFRKFREQKDGRKSIVGLLVSTKKECWIPCIKLKRKKPYQDL